MAAALQKEMKDSITVVATKTLIAGRGDSISEGMLKGGFETRTIRQLEEMK
jgi:hypothetical protein